MPLRRLATLAVLAVLAMPVAPSAAAGPPAAAVGPQISLRPSSASVGTSVEVSGAGFDRQESGRLFLNGSAVGMPTYKANPKGAFKVRFTVPTGTTAGAKLVEARNDAGLVRASATLTVTSAGATPTPTPTPTPKPTATPTPSPKATPTPVPQFYFWGRGTDHGAGMSQHGARGRANAGQSFGQILAHYYNNTAQATIDGRRLIRVQLAANYVPTAAAPARLTSLAGTWTSPLFPALTFAQGSYVDMWPPHLAPPDPTPVPAGHWVVVVYNSVGGLLARATATDFVMQRDSDAAITHTSFKDSAPNMNQFRGSMRLTVTGSGGLQQVNILPLDVYLRGVVPAEMPGSWNVEAVKSQAVAARSYAWTRIKTTGSYDVLPTAANQVYKGVLIEYPRSDTAVAQTAGVVLVYNGNVISANYHSAAGGYTENSEYAFPSSSGTPGSVVGYLRGKPDVNASGVAYDASASSFYWESAKFTMAQLSQIMSNNSATDVGTISNLTFDRGVSGRIYRVTLTGSKGTKTVSGGVFKNTYNNNRLSGGAVGSTMYFLTGAP